MKKTILRICNKKYHWMALWCCFFVFIGNNSNAQDLKLTKPREPILISTNLIWSTINYTLQANSPKIPVSGNSWLLGKADALHSTTFRSTAKHISDATLIATGILSGLSMLGENKNNNLKKIFVTAESVWLTANITHSIKMLAQRNRPYTQAQGFEFSKRDDVYSFFSGHSSIAAAFVTSAILMRQVEPLSPKGHKILITGACVTGGITAFMRVRAGKHYPSDIFSGMLTGIGIAWLNYKIHEK